MTSLSEFVTIVCCLATGIADAGNVGASAKAQAANPINKIRFMFPPLNRVIAQWGNDPGSTEFLALPGIAN
jgi:hypothetical protein